MRQQAHRRAFEECVGVVKGRDLGRGDNQLEYAEIEEIKHIVSHPRTNVDDDDVRLQRAQLAQKQDLLSAADIRGTQRAACTSQEAEVGDLGLGQTALGLMHLYRKS